MLVTPGAGVSRPGRASSHVLGDLTDCQRQAVETPSRTVCVLASAGAGKTRVLTRRIGYRVVTGSAQAEHVLAITFTRKAAGELRARLAGQGLVDAVTAGTFHSLALSQLRRWWADRRAPEPVLLQRKARLLAELVAERPQLRDVGLADLAGQVEWAKARLVSPAAFAEVARSTRRELPADADAIAALYARYEDEKRRRRVVDFDDLLSRYSEALSSDARFAAAQRWKWQHLFVDELQDVNPLQCRVLLALLGDNEDLFVVGDPNQAIYGWNGADPAFLSDFPQRWPNAEVVRLDDNHRSSPQVVAAAAAVLGRQCRGELRSSRPNGPLPRLRSFPNEDAEAAGIAAQVRAAAGRGLDWHQMAVLARTNSQLTCITEALSRAQVPFRALALAEETEITAPGRGQGGEPGDGRARPAVSRPTSGPAVSTESGSQVTVCTFHRSKGLQWEAVWICGLEAGIVPIAYASSPPALAEERRLLYVAITRAERELRCSWARERRTSAGTSLRREPSPWLPVLATHCEAADVGTGDHPANGKRAPAGADATVLDFVALARRRLAAAKVASGKRAGGFGGDRGGRHRGPGVAGTPAGFGLYTGAYDDGDEEEPDPVGTAVSGQLREWRRRLARASGVPPHVLMHDATVEAVAARRPANAQELVAVPGLGPVKVARYGPAILEVVREAVAGAGAVG